MVGHLLVGATNVVVNVKKFSIITFLSNSIRHNSWVRGRVGRPHIHHRQQPRWHPRSVTCFFHLWRQPALGSPKSGLPKSCSFHPGSSLENNPYGKSNPEVLTYLSISFKHDANHMCSLIFEYMERDPKKECFLAEWTTAQDQEPK